MKGMPQISEAELEVMKALWELGQATSSQIVDKLMQGTQWKPKTIQTLITRLVAKGAVKVEDTFAKAFIYMPVVKEEDYKAYANESFLKRIYNGSVNLMLTSFIKEKKLTKEEIEALRSLLEEEV